MSESVRLDDLDKMGAAALQIVTVLQSIPLNI